jgi:hypothetical protein
MLNFMDTRLSFMAVTRMIPLLIIPMQVWFMAEAEMTQLQAKESVAAYTDKVVMIILLLPTQPHVMEVTMMTRLLSMQQHEAPQ